MTFKTPRQIGPMELTSTPLIRGVTVLTSEGVRVYAKYYDPHFEEFSTQQEFETKVYLSSLKANARSDGIASPLNPNLTVSLAEVLIKDGYCVLYQFVSDVFFYVIASDNENELIVASVLEAVVGAVQLLLRDAIDSQTIMERLNYVMLVVDEVIDEGLILELDPQEVSNRVLMHGEGEELGLGPISEQSLQTAFKSAKEQFFKSFRQ